MADNKKSAIECQIVNSITGKKIVNKTKMFAKDDQDSILKWKQ